MDMIIVELASTAAIAITVFGIVLSLTQSTFSHVRRSYAAFLGAVALTSIPDALSSHFANLDDVYIQLAELLIWTPVVLCVPPLFWLYLFALTSTDLRRPKRAYRHFILPALALFAGLLAAGYSDETRTAIFLTTDSLTMGWSLAIVAFALVFQVAQLPQMAVYLFLIVRRMISYRLTLRDHYASTEEHELRWVWVIGGLGVLYWLARTLFLFLAYDSAAGRITPGFVGFAAVFGLALVGALTLWGLRQRPPLVLARGDDHAAKTEDPPGSKPSAAKYEKSALSPEAAARIARKLRAAMEDDHLHRDANLSLWGLAQHIGASPNYISQTLSEEIGVSFFDFVNGYRVAEAKTLLAETDDTVLAITYEVGFNARSSFYNAFKRATGETPTRYRKTLSQPAGLDDSAP